MQLCVLFGILLLLQTVIGGGIPRALCLIALDKSSYSNALNFAKNIQSNDIDVSIYAAMSDTPVLRGENMRNYR